MAITTAIYLWILAGGFVSLFRLFNLHEKNERTLMREAPDTVICECGNRTLPNVKKLKDQWSEYNTHKDVSLVYWYCKQCKTLNVYGIGFSLNEASVLARAEIASNALKTANRHGNFPQGVTINRTWLHQVPGIFQI